MRDSRPVGLTVPDDGRPEWPARPARRVGSTEPDGGQASVLLVVLLLFVATGAAVVLANLGGVAADRARARTAADAAALAGAASGRAAADAVATVNGGQIESYLIVGPQIEVTVRVGRARATARAEVGAPRSERTVHSGVTRTNPINSSGRRITVRGSG
jgi:hypothetical protein